MNYSGLQKCYWAAQLGARKRNRAARGIRLRRGKRGGMMCLARDLKLECPVGSLVKLSSRQNVRVVCAAWQAPLIAESKIVIGAGIAFHSHLQDYRLPSICLRRQLGSSLPLGRRGIWGLEVGWLVPDHMASLPSIILKGGQLPFTWLY